MTGAMNAFCSAGVIFLPFFSSCRILTVRSTFAACSPPMTPILEFGHIHRSLGWYARPHMP